MDQQKSNLSKTQVLTLLNNEYSIKFPNTGQMMDIETLKWKITSNKYDELKFSVNVFSQRQALIAEALSTFIILLPDLKKSLTAESLFDLDFEQMDAVLDMYVEQYLPWYEEWMSLMTKPKATEPDKNATNP